MNCRRCPTCRKAFKPNRDVQEYCSRKCSLPVSGIEIRTPRRAYAKLARLAAKTDPGNYLPNF